MSILHKKSKSSCSTVCKTSKWILAAFLFLTTVAALVGVYETHVRMSSDGLDFALQFGATSGSLAIIAFVLSSVAWMKHIASCMSDCEVCK